MTPSSSAPALVDRPWPVVCVKPAGRSCSSSAVVRGRKVNSIATRSSGVGAIASCPRPGRTPTRADPTKDSAPTPAPTDGSRRCSAGARCTWARTCCAPASTTPARARACKAQTIAATAPWIGRCPTRSSGVFTMLPKKSWAFRGPRPRGCLPSHPTPSPPKSTQRHSSSVCRRSRRPGAF